MPPERLRAPKEHGAILSVPPLAEAVRLLEANCQRFGSTERGSLTPSPLAGEGRSRGAALRQLAIRDALAAARSYHDHLGLPFPEGASSSLIVIGHQPELFHPGVWVKNFAAAGLAKAHGLTSLNLIVDNDVVKSTAIRVPVLEGETPHVQTAPFDRWSGPVPTEDLPVRDETTFAHFAQTVAEVMHWHGPELLLPQFWRAALGLSERTPLLGERLAGARQLIEAQWGCENLELPLSRVCETESFARFALDLLLDLPHFQAIYNDQLLAYRQRHRIKSRNHPVPDLDKEGDWLEAPFWVWRSGETQCGRLFARRQTNQLELRCRDQVIARLPLDAEEAVAAWPEVMRSGFKVRTRALTTTLFARVFLAELFIHGIGGAIYDELTDAIIREFYRIEPPAFLTLSATLLLPLAGSTAPSPSVRDLRRQQRDLWYNPDRHLWENDRHRPQVRELLQQKQSWIDRQPSDHAAKLERFHTIRQLSAALRPYVGNQRDELPAKIGHAENREVQRQILGNREYAFCLYPEAMLREFMCVVMKQH